MLRALPYQIFELKQQITSVRSVMVTVMMTIFLIALLGYILGKIELAGLQLGTSGVLLIALVFGHLGFEVPSVVRELGLICFCYICWIYRWSGIFQEF
ncbi:MAG: hypothetical protein ACOX2A_05430 [Tepidanaerobacteraceae bacterium]